MNIGEKIAFLLAKTLRLDGDPEGSNWAPSKEPSLADNYEYVMCGKVFKVNHTTKQNSEIEVFASYGGLVMSLKGDARHLQKIELDTRIYVLIRKVID